LREFIVVIKMQKLFKKLLFIAFVGGVAIQASAQVEKKDGYVVSYDGTELKTFYGECVHSFYYNRDTEERPECGGIPDSPKPNIVSMPKTIIETIIINDENDVLFNFDTEVLTLHGNNVLTKFVNKTGKNNIVKITIDGYTDAIGSAEYNLNLSKERADSVKNFFIAHGFPVDKIITRGYGEKDTKISHACLAKYPQTNPHLRSPLIKCAAADRKVVITVEHDRQVKKTIMEKVVQESDSRVESQPK
jgi:outer membrane protein OmpA-like peptidoglycan-associated protein